MTDRPRTPDIVAAFDRAARREWRERVLLQTESRDLRYGEIVKRAGQLARFARDRGWESGDRVVVASRDPVACTTLHLALLRNGYTSIVVDPECPAPAALALLALSQPRGIFVDHDISDRWRMESPGDVCEISDPKHGSLFRKLIGAKESDSERYPDCFDAASTAELPARIEPDSDAYLLFTSGSTATPKAVRVGHRALFAHLETLRRVFDYDESTRLLNVLPLHHTDGMNHGPVSAFVCGGRVHRPFPFRLQDLGALLDSIYTHRITHWITVPTLLALVDQLGREPGDDYADSFETGDFRTIVCSAAPLPTSLWEGFQREFRTPVANVYGLTETVVGGLFSGGSAGKPMPGTVGVPVDCEVRVVDGNGAVIADSGVGEIEIRGDNLFSGYFGDAAASEAAFRDGWFRTGDLGSRDPDGHFRITGRRKNLIIRGGVNVQPEEVSEALVNINDVVEAVTFGEPDPVFGERIIACVTLFDGSAENEASLKRHCRSSLVPDCVPTRIIVLPALPKGESGKIQIDLVRRLAESRGPRSGSAGAGGIEVRVLALAADCFDLPASTLSPRSTPRDTPGWDSFAHLEFVVALEDDFSIRLSTRDILRLENLALAIEIVTDALP